MHIRTKFDDGKQINRSQEISWQGRCAGAALRWNEGAVWGPSSWKKATGGQPTSTFEQVAAAAKNRLMGIESGSQNMLLSCNKRRLTKQPEC